MDSSPDVRALTEEFHVLRNSKDPLQGILDRFEPDGRFQILGPASLGAFTQKYEGRDAIRAAVIELVAAWDLSGVANIGIYTDGDTTVTHRKGRVRSIADNIEFDTEYMDKMTFRDGKIVEYLQFVDTLGIAEAVGMVRFA